MGESITGGILANWRVKDGDTVKRDQPIFELETDKITSEGVAESDGVIHISVEAGSEVKIGQVIATIDASAAAAKPAPSASAAAPIENPKSKIENVQSPAVRRIAEETGVDPSTVAGSGKAGRVTKGDMLQAVESTPPPAATPAASANPKSEIQNPK